MLVMLLMMVIPMKVKWAVTFFILFNLVMGLGAMAAAGLPSRLSPHSFRVATITDLLEQGVPLEDVQNLAGHADPRTTRLYDRRSKKVTRNIVERISI